MSRPATGWAHLAAALARVLGGPDAWLSAETQAAGLRLLTLLAADAQAVIARDGVDRAAAVLGVSRSTLYDARATGWLSDGEREARRG